MTSLATPEVLAAVPLTALTGQTSLADIAQAHDVRFLLATFVDMTGKPCAKLVPVEAADELENGAMGFAGYAAGLMGQKPQDSDLIVVPDLASFTPVPFIKEGLAIIHCDPHVGGKPWPYAPRVILKNALARLAGMGMQAKVGAEVEYFLVKKNDDGTLSTADERDDSPRPCYDAPALQAFLAPTVNSYKRTGATTSSSGATWSPRKASFGGNDRTHMIRVPDNKRIELRSGDGSANPYLAIATAIAAGLDGVEKAADPGAPSGPGESKPDAHLLPATLLHAVEALRKDPVILASLSGDPEIGAYYATAKEEEFLSWHNQVSDWEIRTYLTSV